MSTDLFSPPSAEVVPAAVVLTSSADERWRAWQAKGTAHDRVVGRRLAFVLPMIVVVGALLYALVVR